MLSGTPMISLSETSRCGSTRPLLSLRTLSFRYAGYSSSAYYADLGALSHPGILQPKSFAGQMMGRLGDGHSPMDSHTGELAYTGRWKAATMLRFAPALDDAPSIQHPC